MSERIPTDDEIVAGAYSTEQVLYMASEVCRLQAQLTRRRQTDIPPIEPTEAMITAGVAAAMFDGARHVKTVCADVYAAMLAAHQREVEQ